MVKGQIDVFALDWVFFISPSPARKRDIFLEDAVIKLNDQSLVPWLVIAVMDLRVVQTPPAPL